MDQQLSPIKRTEVSWLRFAKPDDTEQFVVHGVGDRHGVGELLRRVDTVAVAHGDVRRRYTARRLPSEDV
jgi:hypothetical protein